MRFSKEKEEQLNKRLQDIFLKCVLKAKEEKEPKYMDEWYFMEEVYNANLVTEPKQYFLLGTLAQKIHDVGPEALITSMRIMGLIEDDDKISKARAYWKDKYGEEEANLLGEKLLIAFRGDKYTLDQIKSMGDKIEIMRGNNKIV